MVKRIVKGAMRRVRGLANKGHGKTEVAYAPDGSKSIDQKFIPANTIVYGEELIYEKREMELLETDFLSLSPQYFINTDPEEGYIGHGASGLVFHANIYLPDFELRKLELSHEKYHNLLNFYSNFAKENGYQDSFAVKILRPEVIDSLDPTGKKNLIRNFHNEGHTLDKLSNILSDCVTKIYDYGQIEGRNRNYHYMMLEEMSPYTLDTIISGLSPEEVGQRTTETDETQAYDFSINSKWRVVEMICKKLAKIHGFYTDPENKITHRDIKPQNILCSKGTKIKLYKDGWRFEDGLDIKFGDLGLVRWLGADSTEGNEILGTYDYMSYEQLNDPKSVDYRTDIFSTGLVLYELIHGENPRYHKKFMKLARMDFLDDEMRSYEYEAILKNHK
ncbi:protein kinase, partial [Candidatus Woesearchaeota archaeon]|nr:protein kinase [Candidatus Woesearchaeota archaeon]